MIIMPISSISDLDQELFNQEIINLAKLKRGGLPVLEGIVIHPTQELLDKIKDIVENYKNKKINISENQFKNTVMPLEIKKYLSRSKQFYFNGGVNSTNIWKTLTSIWWGELLVKYKSFQSEFNSTIDLSEKIIFILDSRKNIFSKFSKIQSIQTSFDEILEDNSFNLDSKSSPMLSSQIDQIIKNAHKFLTFPHNFDLIIWNNQIFIVGIKPYTNPINIKKLEKTLIKNTSKSSPKSAIKVYYNLPKISFKTFVSTLKSEDIEDFNCILNGEDFPNFEKRVEIIDYLKENFSTSNIIYKLPDISENNIYGSLRLLHQPKLLEDACNFVLFLRNKKNVGGLDISIPHIRSTEELLKIKRELASYGINHRNGMKIWLEICTPENLINIDKYLETDIEGLIINLDKIEKLLVGFKTSEEQNQILGVESILELLVKVFKSAHKLDIPIIIGGKNYITEGLLETFISWGVYGLIVNSLVEAQSLPYYLALLEKKFITARLNLPN